MDGATILILIVAAFSALVYAGASFAAKRARARNRAAHVHAHGAQRKSGETPLPQGTSSALRQERRRREDVVLNCTFSLVAALVAIDGRTTSGEMKCAERLCLRFHVDGERKRRLLELFEKSLHDGAAWRTYADELSAATQDEDVRVFIYEFLWDVACADHVLAAEEAKLLAETCARLKLSPAHYDVNYRRRRATFHDAARAHARAKAADALAAAYAALGCAPSDSDDVVKAHYHAAAKRNHPDLLRANGVPESEIAATTEKMAALNAAWKLICRRRAAV